MPSAIHPLGIITYHAIDNSGDVIATSPALFRQQMAWLSAKNLKGISLVEAFEHLDATGRFPDRSVVLTFDDGFQSVLEVAMPELRRHKFSATLFMPSDFVGRRDMIDEGGLQTLAGEGIEIGAHSVSHCDLTRISSELLQFELADGKQRLEQLIQRPVRSLAYPTGYHNQSVRKAAAGLYWLACTTELGFVSADDDRMRLKRLDAYFLKSRGTWDRTMDGRLSAYWAFRQQLRNIKDRFR